MSTNIMKRMMLKGLAVSMVAGAASVSTSALAAEYNWKFQIAESPGSIATKYYQEWVDNVKTMSGGRIEITLLPINSVVKHTETFEAIGSGILDGHLTAVSYLAGLDAGFGLLGNTVGAWGSASELGKYYYSGGGHELLNELYKPYNVYSMGMVTNGIEAFVSSRKLNGVADLKGLKMRAPEGMVSNVFKAAGARPVNLPTSEVYTSLDKGVIDAADYSSFAVNASLDLHKVAKHPVYPGFHSMPLLDVSVSLDTWNSLPADLQTILQQSIKGLFVKYAFDFEMRDGQAVKDHVASGGTYTNWSAAERNKFRAIAVKEWKKASTKSKNAKKVYNHLTTFLKDNGMLD